MHEGIALCRAKLADQDTWAYGYIVDHGESIVHIYVTKATMTDSVGCGIYRVDPDTIGEYTGILDYPEGQMVFEGDVVHAVDELEPAGHPFREFDGVVGFRNASFIIKNDDISHYRWVDYTVSVIGNIHDNPELMQEE